MGGLYVNSDLYTAVVLVVNVHVQKCQCCIGLLLMCEFDVSFCVHCVKVVGKGLCVSNLDLLQYVIHVSFPKGGFEWWWCCDDGFLLQVLHKKKKTLIMAERGLPMVNPSFWL